MSDNEPMDRKQYLRERLLIPIGIPLAAVAVTGGVVYLMSRMLLALDEKTAPLVGLLVALDILFAAGVIAAGRLKGAARTLLVMGAVLFLVIGGVAGLAVGERPVGEEHAAEEKAEEPAGGAEKPAASVVDVGDNFFEPRELAVPAGTEVTWEQSGVAPHTVTADDGSFDSHPDCQGANLADCMQKGDTFKQAFDSPGQVAYYCRIHGAPGGVGMAGVIVVE